MSRVDAHHHVFDRSRYPQLWIQPATMAVLEADFFVADLAPAAAEAAIDQTVLVQTVNVASETDYFLAIAAAEPLVAGVVGWCDLQAPDLADQLAAWRSGPGGEFLVGVRHLVQWEPDPEWLDRPAVRTGLAAVAEAGLVFDLVIQQPQWAAAVRLAREMPELVCVLDHLGKPPLTPGADLSEWVTAMRDLGRQPNVSAKVSGLVTEASWSSWTVADLQPAVDVAVEAFGSDRVLFGSDWPVCLLATDYGSWVDTATELMSGCSPADLDAYFGDNARRVYGLPAVRTAAAR